MKITTALSKTTTSTTTVLLMTCFLFGQTTFFISLLVSRKNFAIFLKKRLIPAKKPFFFSVFSAMSVPPFLLCLAVERMLAAEAAILLHLEPVGAVLFVLLGVVVALFALRAGERD